MAVINTKHLFKEKNYSSAKNLQDFWCHYRPEKFGLDVKTAANLNLIMADASWLLSDYQFAVETYKMLIERFPELDSEEIQQRIMKFETEYSIHEQRVFCDNDMLRPILERLRYVYDGIDRPICVFVAEDEEAYIEFHQKRFPGREVYPFNGFDACGFYGDPVCYWLVFKAKFLDGSKSVDALTGLCAHELAHIDLVAKRVHHGFLYHREDCEYDFLIQERMTDLYVLSKGLLYPLYAARKEFGASKWVISVAELVKLIDHLQKIDNEDEK